MKKSNLMNSDGLSTEMATTSQDITPYHWERIEIAEEEAARMLEHPFSLQEMIDQMERNELLLEKNNNL